ncbi:MAG TPA: hemagglutinin repeat-containing protein, partial [Rhodocyclaceae bacterium]
MTVAAARVDNGNTQGTDQGLEGNSLRLTATQIDNSHGAIRANDALSAIGSSLIDNSAGVISSAGTLTVQDTDPFHKTLAVTNTGGTLIAGQMLDVDAASLTGDGDLSSIGDMRIKLDQDFLHTGQLAANGNARLETAGTITNRSMMKAGSTLDIRAAAIDNQASGTLSATTIKLLATDSHTLTNRGLIDGADTFLDAVTLDNLGTGRIYGDHVAIAAATLNNLAEGSDAPVIAARSRLDIGGGTINNGEHALLFSAGDMSLGGSLDASHLATGAAAAVNNRSATIEALGSINLSARQIQNTNEHFATVDGVLVGSEGITEYQGSGSPNRYRAGTPGVFIYNDESDHLATPEGSYEDWIGYYYTRTTTESQVQSSDPAKIMAGGGIVFTADTLLNDKSQIVAGGTISGTIGSLTNAEVLGTRTVTDSGTVTSYWRDHQKGRDSTGSSSAAYNPAPAVQTITLSPTLYRQNTAPTGTGTHLAAFNAARGVFVFTDPTAPSVPRNSLYRISTAPASHYLIESDSRFTDYRSWLSSDYLLSSLLLDPAVMQKRLGDGFYEQKLIREQVAELTGHRFLDGYASDEAQYRALMDNGATYAKAHQLVPGVALSAEQIAQLTSDIVWLVEKTVTLPDGRTAKALVPQVYVRVQAGDLTASGALVSADSINLRVTGDLVNSGTIAGRNVVALTADNLKNIGGRIGGANVGLSANTDLINQGGRIEAGNALMADAGRDLVVSSTTTTQSNAQGSRTNVDRVAGLYVSGNTGSDGLLLASAGRDLTLAGAEVRNDATGATQLTAGRDVNLATVTESSSNRIVWDGANRRSDSSRAETGTTIQTQGDLALTAGNDLTARAATVTSDKGALLASAGRDLRLTAGEANVTVDEAHQHTGTSSAFSSTTITTRDTVDRTSAQGSTFSGNTATLQAGRDVQLTGSNAVASQDATVTAARNLTVEAATETDRETHFRQETKSGLFSSGGLGITLGTQEQSVDQQGVGTSAAGSTVGSIEGNVILRAGEAYRQVGSQVSAPAGDVDIAAKKVDILEARETNRADTKTEFKQSGLTVAITSPVISAIQTAQQMGRAAGNTKDGRMKALAAANTAMAAKNAVDAIKAGQGTTIGGKPNQIPVTNDKGEVTGTRDANAADKAGGIDVSISLGSSRSSSNSTQTSDSAAGSSVTAGNDVRIVATGAGQDSNLTVQGSRIQAGTDLTLQADNDIRLLAARNTAEQHSSNSSGSASVGVSFGTNGLLFTAGASRGRGNADGNDVAWTNADVHADGTLTLKSGGDTTLKGATATGKQVVADVGRDLAIESLQDTSRYDSKQQNVGGSISIGYGKMGGSFSAGQS